MENRTINLTNFSNWAKMQGKLAELGFYPDPFDSAIFS